MGNLGTVSISCINKLRGKLKWPKQAEQCLEPEKKLLKTQSMYLYMFVWNGHLTSGASETLIRDQRVDSGCILNSARVKESKEDPNSDIRMWRRETRQARQNLCRL